MTQHIQLALTDQHLAMQSWLNSSWPSRGVAGARECGTPGWYVLKDEGVGNHHSGGTERDHVGGRSRLMPAVLNDFWLVDEGSSRSTRFAGWALGSECTRLISAGPSVASCDTVTGCGAADAAAPDRTAQLPTRALNRHSTATMAMSGRHREGLPASRKITVAQLYQRRRLVSFVQRR